MQFNTDKFYKKNTGIKIKTSKDKDVEKVNLSGSAGSVLVMDDDASIRVFTRHMLEVSGYKVFLTSNGKEAVEYYRKAKKYGFPFDAVILDLNIPNGIGGKEVVRKLREADPHVKAIVSSGEGADPALTNYREYGFIDVLPKPFTINELTQVLHRVIKPRWQGIAALR